MFEFDKDAGAGCAEMVSPPTWRFGSQAELQAIFIHAPLPVLLLDEHGDILLSNRVFGERTASAGYGLAIGEALRCAQALTRDGACQCGRGPACRTCPLRGTLQEAIKSQRHFHRRAVTLTVNGYPQPQLFLLVSTVPVRVAGQSRVLVYLEDVSELQRMRAIAEQYNRELEREVNERTLEVRQLLEQKQGFINQLGHDLRTPLTPMIALLPLLRQRTDDPKTLEMIDVIESNAAYMRNLVGKTLDLIRAARPSPEQDFRSVDLRQHVDETLAGIEPLLTRAEVHAINAVPAPLRVRANATQLREVLMNLFDNALRFMEPGGRLTASAERRGNEVMISVRDTGIGMLPLQLTRVFEEFYKVDESRHDRHSPGLGLSICKQIVENHGGRIWADSDGLGKGSTLSFTLPVWAGAAGMGPWSQVADVRSVPRETKE